MATARSSKITTSAKTSVDAKQTKSRNLNFFGLVYKLNLLLMTVGLLIWIFVGSFFSISVVEQLKALASQKVSQAATPQVSQVESPKEVNIPGIGMVNLECVKSNVKQEVLQKISIGTGDDLTEEEKTQFDSCLTQTPVSPSPSEPPITN